MSKIETLEPSIVLSAFAMLGDVKFIPSILRGEYKDHMLCVCYWRMYSKMARERSDIESPEMESAYETFIDNLRHVIEQEILAGHKYALEKEEREFRRRNAQIRTDFLSQNKVHDQGTVAEIAARLGISKSEVRKRKQAGAL